MIYTKKIDISFLTTHIFKLDEAPAAYDLIMSKSEPFIGILIEYDSSNEINLDVSKVSIKQPDSIPNSSEVVIGFIGAGSHAQSYLLPHIPKTQKVQLKGVLNASSTSARSVAERFGFEFCTGNWKDIIDNKDINTLFIATRHDSHVNYVINALRSGKHVFVEKPLCLTFDQLEEIKNCYERSAVNHQQLLVGYNRRFSPLARAIKKNFGSECMAMTYRVNAGNIPPDSWVQDADLGGGRIIGEVCHFIDFLTYINGSSPTSVFAAAMKEPNNLNDVVNISLLFQNGSIGNICYFANGDMSLPKERFEAFCNGNTAVLEDFKTLTIYTQGKKKEKKLLHQDKGQKAEVRQFVESILNGTGPIIPIEEIYNSSLVTFKIIESIRSGRCIKI